MRFFRLRVLLLILFLIPATAVWAQKSAQINKEKLDTYLQKLVEADKFMGSVALDSAGKEVFNRGYGYLSLEENKKADASTKYRVGSVTKTFTAVMIMQLVEEGKLSLADKLAGYYLKLPQAEEITIEHMLRHQSGLYNFTNSPDYPKWMTEKRTKEQMLELFRNQETQFAPGKKTMYSNTNYVLLSYILEDITGESYSEQLQNRITEPLGLENTYYGDEINIRENEAESYRWQGTEWKLLPETDMSIPAGAGALVSTPDDLTDFIRALFNGKLVSQKSLDKMTKIDQRLGIGLMKIPFYDTYAYGHNGGIDGFQANVSYFPQEDIAFSITSNALNYSNNDIMIGILSIYFDHDFKIPEFNQKVISLSSKQMQTYVGTYSSKKLPMDIRVFVKDSVLMAQGTGQQPFPLSATDKTTLRFAQAGVVMKFDSLEGGKYQQFMLNQAGGKYLFKRQN